MTPSETHFEPLEAARVWHRHSLTGDRGYPVKRQGRDAMRYDRGPHIDQYSFDLNLWKLEVDKVAEFSAIQIAQVCFEADKKLCWAMGLPELSKREWLDMSEKRRIAWVGKGPLERDAGYARRARLYKAIKSELEAS